MKSLHFLYHELRPVRSSYSYVMPCDEFERHCEFFARLQRDPPEDGYRPEITFDDGNASDAEFAMPALERHGLKATFFVTAGWIGKRSGFLGWSQGRELLAAGHRIGAHGMTHKLLTGCSAVELQQELQGARQRLEEGLGVEVSCMSLPGGRANGRVLRACSDAGYRQIFSSAPRAELMAESPRMIGRLNLLAGTSTEWLERVLQPGTGVLAKLQRTHQVKTAAKLLLGDGVYARLWALANRQEAVASEEASTA